MTGSGAPKMLLILVAALVACDPADPGGPDGGTDSGADAASDASTDGDAPAPPPEYPVCPRRGGAGGVSCIGLTEIAWTTPTEEEVSFEGGGADLSLEGVVTIPTGAYVTPGAEDGPSQECPITAFPAVVMIHDEGPQSRDAPVGGQLAMDFGGREIPVFSELAAAMAARGFLVVRFDKRTCTADSGCSNGYPTVDETLRFADLQADAAAALAYALSREDVVASDVTLVGFGQGGQIAPALAAEAPAVTDVVLLSAPHSPVDELLARQVEWARAILEAEGHTAEEIDAEIGELEAAALEVEAIRSGSSSAAEVLGRPTDFWRGWMEAGDATPATLAELDAGVLVVHGDYDWTVPISEATAFEADLASEVGASTVVLAELTHPLVRVTEPDFLLIEPDDIGSGVDEVAIDTLLDWLTRAEE